MKVTVVNGNVDKANKILKRRMLKANLMKTIKNQTNFVSPTKSRREKLNETNKIIFKYNENLKNTRLKK